MGEPVPASFPVGVWFRWIVGVLFGGILAVSSAELKFASDTNARLARLEQQAHDDELARQIRNEELREQFSALKLAIEAVTTPRPVMPAARRGPLFPSGDLRGRFDR